ncbi:MAG: hypothetical protein J6S72_02110 [Lachnospiraceae bacterium]|nr:hypothetical protein [Lachnospiraceae bacterium]
MKGLQEKRASRCGLLGKILAFVVMFAVLLPGLSGVTEAKAAAVGKVKWASAELNSKSQPVLKWKEVSGATGYRLYRKTDDSAKWVKVTTTKKTGATDKKVAETVTEVKYRVRAYKTKENGKKSWGKYSSVKTLTIDRGGSGQKGNDDPGKEEGSKYPSAEEARAAIYALQADYPEGRSWTNANSYVWGYDVAIGLGYGGFTGYGCQGFAMIASDAAYGKSTPAYQFTDTKRILVGDILRISNDSHSVVVLAVDGKNITIAEGNFNSSIHWGRTINLDTCGFVYGYTRVPLE